MPSRKTTPQLADINKKIAALQQQAAQIRKKEVAEVVAKIKVAIAHYGLTAADLGLDSASVKRLKQAAPKKGSKKVVAKPASRPIKFKDDVGNTWVGHGKRPKWFVDALAAGKKPEDLLVKA